MDAGFLRKTPRIRAHRVLECNMLELKVVRSTRFASEVRDKVTSDVGVTFEIRSRSSCQLTTLSGLRRVHLCRAHVEGVESFTAALLGTLRSKPRRKPCPEPCRNTDRKRCRNRMRISHPPGTTFLEGDPPLAPPRRGSFSFLCLMIKFPSRGGARGGFLPSRHRPQKTLAKRSHSRIYIEVSSYSTEGQGWLVGSSRREGAK